MRIQEIRDGKLFHRLVRALLVAERGEHIIVVDDAGGDGGLDVYDPATKTLYAAYCPEKPETSHRVREKSLKDLGKALRLRESAYQIDNFVFVTPRDVREPVVKALRLAAEPQGVAVGVLSEVHLEDLFRKHAHLHPAFPELTYPDLSRQFAELSTKIDGVLALVPEPLPIPAMPEDPINERAPTHLFSAALSPQLTLIQARLDRNETDAVHALERFRLTTTVPADRFAAQLLELQHYAAALDIERVIHLADLGFLEAQANGAKAEAAVFTAYSAWGQTFEFVHVDTNVVSRVAMTNKSGIPLITPEEKRDTEVRLIAMQEEIDGRFKRAMADARAAGNLEALYQVLLLLAHSHTQRSFGMKMASEFAGATDAEKELKSVRRFVEAAYEAAIPIASLLGDPRRVVVAYTNYANDLAAFDDLGRALSHARHAVELSRQAGDHADECKAQAVLDMINRRLADDSSSGNPATDV